MSIRIDVGGHTLNLISQSSSTLISNWTIYDPLLSDHYAICAALNVQTAFRPTRIIKQVRKFSAIDPLKFSQAILESDLYLQPTSNVRNYLTLFKGTITHLLDRHAPAKTFQFQPGQTSLSYHLRFTRPNLLVHI